MICLFSALAVRRFNELCFIYHNFRDIALLSVLIVVSAGLDASYKTDPASLAEILLYEGSCLSPSDAADEISLSLAVAVLEAAVYRHREVTELGLV